MAKQLGLFKSKMENRFLTRTTHGGDQSIGKRKTERPFASNKWIHLVLKLEKHRLNFFQGTNRIAVTNVLKAKAQVFGVVIGEAVVMKDHIHIKAKSGARMCFQNFLRSITGTIARAMTKARRGVPFGTFWRRLAYTRVLKTAKEVLYLKGYFAANRAERDSNYQMREEILAQYRQWVRDLPDGKKQAKSLKFAEALL